MVQLGCKMVVDGELLHFEHSLLLPNSIQTASVSFSGDQTFIDSCSYYPLPTIQNTFTAMPSNYVEKKSY